MALIHVITRKKAQALSNRTVFCLAFVITLVCLSLIGATMTVMIRAGYWWLALMIVTPLSTGLGNCATEWLRYCRPDWFRPAHADQNG